MMAFSNSTDTECRNIDCAAELCDSHDNQLVFAPAGLGRLHFNRSSLRVTAPQQKD